MTSHASDPSAPDRRRFTKLAAAGALAGLAPSPGAPAKRPLPRNPPGIKIAMQAGGNITDEDLQFTKQLGLEWVYLGSGGERPEAADLIRLRKRVEDAGLKVCALINNEVINVPEITLNLPGRDKKIEEYKAYLRRLGEAGIHYAGHAYMGNGIWSSDPEPTRGGATGRAFNAASPSVRGAWAGQTFREPLSHGRKYSAEELWDNYAYFIRQVVPLAESLGIRIGMHPDDPPAPVLGGVPRCIFGSFDGYRRALEIAASPNIGILLCVGCWLEGGKYMGRDIVETIRYFGPRGQIFFVHFRNVSAPLPHFVETFIDSGYMEMYKVMKALREVDYDGYMIADHYPAMVGGPRAAQAYSVAYMKAYLERANQEHGG
jgi:mannonate dehydratase